MIVFALGNKVMGDHADQNSLTVGQISNLIESSQLKDIKLYTRGHLNEANLWKIPEKRQHMTWESAYKPHISSRPAHVFNKKPVNATLVNDMCDSLAEFSLGVAIPTEKRQDTARSANKDAIKKDVYIEELKLPNILVAKKHASMVSASAKTPFNSSVQFFPKLNPVLTDTMPKTDIEIAYKIIDSPFNGATKQEKFKNLKKFEENVIQKSDLTNSNVLHDTSEVRRLQDKLVEVCFLS